MVWVWPPAGSRDCPQQSIPGHPQNQDGRTDTDEAGQWTLNILDMFVSVSYAVPIFQTSS